LYPANHPLNITFDDKGVCSGCRVHEEKDELDWNSRWKKLGKLFDSFRNRSGSNYDCIIPVSGARDSYFIVHTVKNEFGLHPLLVSYNKQYNTRVGINNLGYLRTLLGCDYFQSHVSPARVHKITRYTLKKMGSIYWHCLAGQTAFPVQVAVRLKIPLIVWGVNQGIDQVGMFSHLDEVEMNRKYRKDHDLMGYEAEDLVDEGEGITLRDLEPYVYPHDKQIERVGVRGIYLGNFIRWDSKAFHEKMIDLYGYETKKQQRTFDTYNDVDCFHYSGVHDYIKYLKWGYGKVTDHATREIRLKRLTREEGINLVSRYQSKIPSDLPQFLRWVKMSKNEFFACIDANRDARIWRKNKSEKWELLDSVSNHINDIGARENRLEKLEPCNFKITSSREPDIAEKDYVLIGRGYVDSWKPPC
jgi:N-acetyl sugar amidotransferase